MIPNKFLSSLDTDETELTDSLSREPVAWGRKIIERLGEDAFNELKTTCGTHFYHGDWFVITKRLTRDDAIEKYGEVTDEEFGPRGGWKSVTFGETKFNTKSLKGEV
jgi:hypothetical protein